MTEFDDEPDILLHDRPPKAHPVLAWLVVLLVAGGVAALQNWPGARAAAAQQQQAPLDQTEIQSRAAVGMEGWTADPNDLLRNVKELDQGSYRDRLRYAVMVGEFLDPNKALEHLDRVERESGVLATRDDRRLAQILRELYTAYTEGNFRAPLAADDAAFLREQLGWYGNLALSPSKGDPLRREQVVGPARKLALVFTAGIFGVCGFGLLGLGILILVLIQLSRHDVRPRFFTGSPYSGFYIETFAVWFLVFTGLLVGAEFLPVGRSRMLVVSCLSLTTLLVVFWPVLRGVPWDDVRYDLGLTARKGFLTEVFQGVVCYIACLPLFALGIILTLIFMRAAQAAGFGGFLAAANPGPVHPIMFELKNADSWKLFQIFFAASVAAPVVEEVFFRGVLYRHLRELTRRTGFAFSFLLSGLGCSFIFAVVHPQGIFGVPALMCLALGFTLFREWRGSLVSCIVAHGINNGLVMLLAVQLVK